MSEQDPKHSGDYRNDDSWEDVLAHALMGIGAGLTILVVYLIARAT